MADEKQVLIEALKKYHDTKFTPGVYEHSIFGKAALLLEKSVEVVRCKDCKYRHTEDCLMQYTDYSDDMDANPEGISVEWCEDNDFCSYGERKDNETLG